MFTINFQINMNQGKSKLRPCQMQAQRKLVFKLRLTSYFMNLPPCLKGEESTKHTTSTYESYLHFDLFQLLANIFVILRTSALLRDIPFQQPIDFRIAAHTIL